MFPKDAAEPPGVRWNINVAVGREDSTVQQCSFLINSQVVWDEETVFHVSI